MYTVDIESSFGTILPSKVSNFKEVSSPLLHKSIVFQLNNSIYKGTFKWFGKINNNIKVFGIETDPIQTGTNGEFNNNKIFTCEPFCGILVKESIKYLEIDETYGYVKSGKFQADKCENSALEHVVVRFNNTYKIGQIVNRGKINDIICYEIETIKDSKKYLVIQNDILYKIANDDGIIISEESDFNTENCDEVLSCDIDKKVGFQYKNENKFGTLKWKGKINGLRCIGVDPDDSKLASDFTKYIENAFWVVICLDLLEAKGISLKFEIDDPKNHDIFIYFKKNTFVRIKNDYGTIINYFLDEQNLYYSIKMDEGGIVLANSIEVKCGAVGKISKKAFEEMKDPNDFGVITIFNINYHVQVKPNSENKLEYSCTGHIVWMGFDGDSTLKFLINLDEPNKHATDGDFFGQKLYNIKTNHGLLVKPDCLIPFGYVPDDKNQESPPESTTVKNYQIPRSKISEGENKGIQGDKNSCYMDTSLFAMFTFQELFDNLLKDNDDDKENQEIVEILRSQIVFPLRKIGYVSFKNVEKFRVKLEKIFPGKKFENCEKDPEELLETLFHRLTPHNPLLKTFDLKFGNLQNCFMTQLFYVNKINDSSGTEIGVMLDRTFLESGILINMPPKCLILQLPRHGTHFKQYSEVNIKSFLDITHLIRCNEHQCSKCSEKTGYLCLECSEENKKFTYSCNNNDNHCKHSKKQIIYEKDPVFKGQVKLELFAILCIEKTHYVAYVKTGEVLGKWIYYDSMATSNKNVLKPRIRYTTIDRYFLKNSPDADNYDDVTRIKKFAFVCFYKNPTLEYYSQDFNYVELAKKTSTEI